jgi:dihydrofolate synthase/folylpolyglutamate synthase
MEGFTIGAFLAFAKTPADVVVLECGMGGRIDITNIFDKKLATVITPISFDHMEYLGNSIERIALEKAMIMRPQTPLIVASQTTKALEIIEILARDQHLVPLVYDRNFSVEKDEETGEWDFFCAELKLEKLPKPRLLGDHQYINFATALTTIFAISDKFEISRGVIKQAISTVEWESRLQKIEGKLAKIFLNQNSELWIDGAHNPSGAFALARWLMNEDDGLKNFVICGFSRNKCKKDFLEKFKDIAEIVAVRVNGEPYPEEAKKISEIGAEINIKIFAAEDLLEAISYIAKSNNYTPCRIVICGSLHLARDVRNFAKMVS